VAWVRVQRNGSGWVTTCGVKFERESWLVVPGFYLGKGNRRDASRARSEAAKTKNACRVYPITIADSGSRIGQSVTNRPQADQGQLRLRNESDRFQRRYRSIAADINTWVEQQTEDKIKDLIAQGVLYQGYATGADQRQSISREIGKRRLRKKRQRMRIFMCRQRKW